MKIPSDLKYTSTDEWVKVEGDVAIMGVSDFAQDQLSDVVFVEITLGVGDQAKKNTTCVTLESVKAAADVNCAVTGEVVEVNEDLPQSPELVNTDPYGAAWMLKIKLANPAELDSLMDAVAYEKYCQERSH
ncbi:MAG TPA: glycine cleavage system protein GcvH [Anaerolineaceae bacterium]